MLDESHVDVAGEQGELDCAKLVESPALAAAARRDGFAPHGRDPFAQRLVLDPLQAGKELRDLRDAVAGRLSCCHDGYIDSNLSSVLIWFFHQDNRCAGEKSAIHGLI